MLKGLLISFSITFGLSVIPVIHFITLWPAPFIGGFVAGIRLQANVNKSLILGILLGAMMALPIVGIVSVVDMVFDFWTDTTFALGIAGALCVYMALLSSLGSMIGGQVSRQDTKG